MATVLATGNGNWSAVVPAYVAGDTVKPDGYTVAIDQDILIACVLDNTTSNGTFTVASACTIMASVIAGGTTCVTCNHTTGIVAFTGNLTGSASGASARAVVVATTGGITVNGNVVSGAAIGVRINSSGGATIIGNITGTGASAGVAVVTTAALYVTGTVTGGAGPGVSVTANGAATITGAVTGGASANAHGVHVVGAGNITIIGAVTGGGNAAAYGVFNAAAGSVTITGNVAASDAAVGVYNALAGTVRITGNSTGGSADAMYGTHNKATGTVAVTGNAVGGTVHAAAYGIYNEAAGVVTISGSATGSAVASGVYNAGAGSITIGSATGGSGDGVYGAVNASTGTITITGNVTGGSGAASYGALNSNAGYVVAYGIATLGSGSGSTATGNTGGGAASIFYPAGGAKVRPSDLNTANGNYNLSASMVDLIVTKAASGDQYLIAPPPTGRRIAFSYARAQLSNGVSDATVVLLKANGVTAEKVALSSAVPSIVLFDAPDVAQWRLLPAGVGAVINLSGAYSIDFVMRYVVVEPEG